MAQIEVTRSPGDGPWRVVVEDRARTTHEVTVSAADLERLARPGEETEAFIRRCFEFLLAREPSSSIMSSFDISVIGRYFPEFEAEIRR